MRKLTVGDIRKAIEGLNGSAEVYLEFDSTCELLLDMTSSLVPVEAVRDNFSDTLKIVVRDELGDGEEI